MGIGFIKGLGYGPTYGPTKPLVLCIYQYVYIYIYVYMYIFGYLICLYIEDLRSMASAPPAWKGEAYPVRQPLKLVGFGRVGRPKPDLDAGRAMTGACLYIYMLAYKHMYMHHVYVYVVYIYVPVHRYICSLIEAELLSVRLGLCRVPTDSLRA